MDPTRAEDLVTSLRDQAILVIGDVMLDHYVWGAVDRISPEAPVPVLHAQRETEVPGGAANVARNVAALGGRPVLIGILGNDTRGERLATLCREARIESHFVIDNRPTTAKVRYIAQSQQLLRVDWEDAIPLDSDSQQDLVGALDRFLPGVKAVVVSDYAKGVICEAVANRLRIAELPVVVDPRPSQKERYKGFYLMTPNQKEAAAIAGTDPSAKPPAEAADSIASHYTENVLVTCGSRGMYLHRADEPPIEVPARARQVYDVTGAGDTVAAVCALAVAAGHDLATATTLANHAAGMVVGKVGTATVTADELQSDLEEEDDATPVSQ
jgi:D-beta-D-heptose 7-phosphate kinase/D-beta-D-heptose 1-phosphate adenosyltransferase